MFNLVDADARCAGRDNSRTSLPLDHIASSSPNHYADILRPGWCPELSFVRMRRVLGWFFGLVHGALPSARAIKDTPQKQVIGELFEMMFDAGGDK